MTFKEKIAKIVRLNKLKINSPSGLEAYIKAGVGAITKYLKNNEEPGEDTIKKILELPGLNKDWWETGNGPVFLDEPAVKPTHEQNGTHNTEKPLRAVPEEVYKNLIEGNTEYCLVLKSQIGKTEDALWVALRAKDDLISDLKQEIAEYRASRTPAQKAK